MSDLISRQAVLDIIQDEWNLHIGHDSDIALGSVKNRVSALPIAYDKEAVVEKLERLPNREADYYYASSNDVIDREDAIEIVKAGGIDE